MSDFHISFIASLVKKYPSVKNAANYEQSLSLLISPEVVRLPQSVYIAAAKAIQEIFSYSRSSSYQDQLREQLSSEDLAILNTSTPNESVLMGYDFHYDADEDQLSLIEINTNASLFTIIEHLYEIAPIQKGFGHTALSQLKSAFFNETKHISQSEPLAVVLIDENVREQKSFFEFCIFMDLFKSWGWSSTIKEWTDPKVLEFPFIYNRCTDFTFSNPVAKNLRAQFLQQKSVFSPNPREYVLLADKSRLIDFAAARISSVLIPTTVVRPELGPTLWENRRNLFFKPRNLFGAKAAYRGKSISRKYFDELLQADFVAQEFRPAGEHNGWKYDLRFYVYQNEIQLVCARLYQGQVTNFSTPGGGLGRVEFY